MPIRWLRLLASKDEELKKRVLSIWGTVRTERNPQREQVIDRVPRDAPHDRGGCAERPEGVSTRLRAVS